MQMEYAIETSSLFKHYKNFAAVNDLNIHVPVGKVYGFLGRNGSGKTTTIRMIMGLIKADKGNIRILGSDISSDRVNAIRKIGAIVESPGAYDNLSAIENLMITARMHNISKYRVKEVMKLVDLSDVGDKRVGKFSLGMKQRLGIANSLIHSPSIVILDEPTNGLDPEGIKQMRSIIRNLSESVGISVLISSHLLSEIEQISDYIGIIDKGHLIQEGDINLIKEDEQSYVKIETDNLPETLNVLRTMNLIYDIEKNAVKVYCHKSNNSIINSQLVYKGVSVVNFSSISKTLEEKFLSLTSNANLTEANV